VTGADAVDSPEAGPGSARVEPPEPTNTGRATAQDAAIGRSVEPVVEGRTAAPAETVAPREKPTRPTTETRPAPARDDRATAVSPAVKPATEPARTAEPTPPTETVDSRPEPRSIEAAPEPAAQADAPAEATASAPPPPDPTPTPPAVESRAEQPVEAAPEPAPPARPVFEAPVLIERIEPEVSDKVLRRSGGGTIVLSILVSEHGGIARVIVEQSAGSADLEAAAINAVLRWRYRPATQDGVAVQAWTTERFVFQP
jgi:protein TonB